MGMAHHDPRTLLAPGATPLASRGRCPLNDDGPKGGGGAQADPSRAFGRAAHAPWLASKPAIAADCPEFSLPWRPGGANMASDRRWAVASATVFVDDAVWGNLPNICVKDGVWTSDRLTLRHRLSNEFPGVAWILLLLGPLGWIGLLIYAASRSGEQLDVRLPFSETAYQRFRWTRWRRNAAGLVFVVTGVLALVVRARPGVFDQGTAILLGAVALGALVMAVVEAVRHSSAGVRIDLDASRRWVTLGRVHPDFATAAQPDLPGFAPPNSVGGYGNQPQYRRGD